MKTIKHYEVLGKVFDTKNKALEYENKIRENLELRARNLKVYYWRTRGYPGGQQALNIINHFCHYHKFNFGKYKGMYIGEIMMRSPQYIKWCIENVPFFKMNKEETVLYNTSWVFHIGGSCYNIQTGEDRVIFGDMPDMVLIEWELEQLHKND